MEKDFISLKGPIKSKVVTEKKENHIEPSKNPVC